MMQEIYVVVGQTGEYSDAQEWLVCAHTTKKEAEDRIKSLYALAKKHGVCKTGYFTSTKHEKLEAFRNAAGGDPNAKLDYTGIRYYQRSIPLYR